MPSPSPSAFLADAIALALRGMRTYRCTQSGCTVRIRFRAVSPEEEQRLIALATDHSRHGSKDRA